MDVGKVLVQVRRFDLPGDVQQRRAGGQCFDQRTGSVARSGAGGGQAHAQATGGAGIGIGHVGRPGFTAGHDEADVAAHGEGIEDRHVVDRDHAEGGLDLALLEKRGDGSANGDSIFITHGGTGLQKHRYGCLWCKPTEARPGTGLRGPLRSAGPGAPRECVCVVPTERSIGSSPDPVLRGLRNVDAIARTRPGQ
ncbi:hypothetical protein D3C80_1536070 [compost metagenome]